MSKATFASRTNWTRKVFTSLTLGAFLFATHAPLASASSWSPTLLVNTESFQVIDDGDGTTDIELRFGTSGKELRYNITSGKVELDTTLDVTGDIEATGDLSVDDATVGGTLTIGGVTYTFPGGDGADGTVLSTNGAGTLSWSDALLESELDSEAELEAQLGGVNVILETEIDSEAELEAIAGADFLKGSEIDTEAEFETFIGADFLKGSEVDTIAELEGFLEAGTNIILETEIDTEAEFEAIVGVDYLKGTEIDTEAEIEALVGADWIKGSEIDTEAEFEGVVGVDYLKGIDVDTQAELESLLTDASNLIDVGEINSQAELEAILADATNVIDVAEIDTQAELEAILTDATNVIDVGEINTEAKLEGLVGVDFLKGSEIDTVSELEAFLEAGTNFVLNAEIDSEAELEGIVGVDYIKDTDIDSESEFEAIVGVDYLKGTEIDTEAELEAVSGIDIVKAPDINTESALESFLSDVSDIFTDNDDSDSITEGATNLFYSDERVDDRVDALLVEGDGITLAYDDGAGSLTITADSLADSADNIGLAAEYPGASYYGDGSNNIGQLLVDYDTSEKENYYKWTSSKAAAQDYNIAVRVRIPENFSAWDGTAPINFKYKTADAASAVNSVTMTMLDTGGSNVALTGAADLTSTTWTSKNITGPNTAGTYTAGEYITIIIAMKTTSAGEANAGYLTLNWDVTNP